MNENVKIFKAFCESFSDRVKYWSEDVEQYLTKFSRHEILILKGHALIEKRLDELIMSSCPYPEYLKLDRIGFYRKVQLVRSLQKVDYPDQFWGIIEKFNILRNVTAHHLEKKNFDKILSDTRSFIIEKLKCPKKYLSTQSDQILWLFIYSFTLLTIVEVHSDLSKQGFGPDKPDSS